MGLFPTGERAPDGRRYWETTAEVDALVAYGLMLGGPFAPGVVEAYKGELPEPPPPGAFDPNTWNLFFVDAGWQRLRIE